MTKLIVHVGMPKTGSTSIQRMLKHRAQLLRANDLHVPEIWTHRTREFRAMKHADLAKELADKTGARQISPWTRLAQEVQGTDATPCVISSEVFAKPEFRDAMARELAAFAERENVAVEIIGYVRPQWQYLEALYTQHTYARAIGGATFQRFVADMLDAGERTMFDYNVVFAPYRAAFGECVKVFPLEPSRLPQGLLAHFLQQCGVPADAAAVARLPHANSRRGAKATEVYRLASARANPERWKLLQFKRLALLIDDDAPFAGLGLAEIRDIEAHFAAANARFARDYRIDDGGVLFRDDAVPAGPRPNIARWQDLSPKERRFIRGYVLKVSGIDLDPGAGNPMPSLQVAARLAWRKGELKVRTRLGRHFRAVIRNRVVETERTH